MEGTNQKQHPDPLWMPSSLELENSNLKHFGDLLRIKHGLGEFDYQKLYDWSIASPDKFWAELFEYFQVKHSAAPTEILGSPNSMPGARWFEGARLNFAENLLSRDDAHDAVVFWGENQVRRAYSYRELRGAVSKVARALRTYGLKAGDRVAGFLPNLPEAIIAMLACTSIGAIWSSCSPDFGVEGVVDRFGQIEPKVLFGVDGYWFKGKKVETLSKVGKIRAKISSVERCIVVPYLGTVQIGSEYVNFEDLLKTGEPEKIVFEQLPFDHPLYILYSSGTTGKPKCIVHGSGGTLLCHLKELALHTDLKPSDRLFYQTTTGWMMWNWLVSGLALGSTLVLYDGSPLVADGRVLFDLAAREKVTIFGTNAKFIASIEKSGLKPATEFDLSAMKTILSTGSPLLPEGFDYVYRNISKTARLSSIAGGTDIVGCFSLGCPVLPVYRGEIQTRGLGLKVQVFDEFGNPCQGKKGELVCSAPFPNMPIYFWNDPSGEKYRTAYFTKYPNVWTHGDYVELTEHLGVIIYGRSDTVLNPGGIRIGTAEIYRQVEKLAEIEESLVVGQNWKGDERVVLFVKLRLGLELSPALEDRIRATIRSNTTAFHVPKKIVAISDIPRTRSGKIVELAIKELIHGREPKNLEALANPEALTQFRALPELGSD